MSEGKIELPEGYERSALKDARGNIVLLDRPVRIWLGADLSECPANEDWVVLKTAREACLLLLASQVTELSLEEDLTGPDISAEFPFQFGRGSEVIGFIEAQDGALSEVTITDRSGTAKAAGGGDLRASRGKPLWIQKTSLRKALKGLRSKPCGTGLDPSDGHRSLAGFLCK